MEHADLILEMRRIDQMTTQERLILAKKHRNQQLKMWNQKEKDRKNLKILKSNKRSIRFNDSVVMLEAAARNDIDEVRRLLMKGVSPDSCNEDGLTPLHQCCIDNNESLLLLLLEYNANVNAEDSEKWTPLHAAATCGHLKLVRILIARGADLLSVNADGNMPYDICEHEATLDYIENEMSKRGVTQSLIDQTRSETERKMLNDLMAQLELGNSLEMYDSQGATPLHIASANGYLSVVQFLLDNHVRTDVGDRDDWQPSHAAACWGHIDVLELLAQAGADLNARNKHDETPSDICEDPEIKERIIALLTEMEIKRQQAEAKRKVRRSQSNTRTQSVRRTSLRDKGLTARRDAVEEARFRLHAEHNQSLDTMDPSNDITTCPKAPVNITSSPTNSRAIGTTKNHQYSINETSNYFTITKKPTNDNSSPLSSVKYKEDSTMVNSNSGHQNLRIEPDGKDNDLVQQIKEPENNQSSTSTPTIPNLNSTTIDSKDNYTTDVNGVTVHVVVTINGNGTLADLKKQRKQIRYSADVSNLSPVGSETEEIESTVTTTPPIGNTSSGVFKFKGETTEEGYDKSKRCCIIQ